MRTEHEERGLILFLSYVYSAFRLTYWGACGILPDEQRMDARRESLVPVQPASLMAESRKLENQHPLTASS